MRDKNTLGPDGHLPQSNAANVGRRQQFRDTCGKCQAVRVDQQLGLERTPEEYVTNIVAVFREVRRVLRPDGVVWLNLGDSYASSPPGNTTKGVSDKSTLHGVESDTYRDTLSRSVQTKRNTVVGSLKPKDLCGIPWRVAFALQADGWWLRSDVIWAKPNPMPESVTDRPTRSHEYLFLLTKSERYWYDADAIREELSEWSQNALMGKWSRKTDGAVPVDTRTGGRWELSGDLTKAGRNYADGINPAGRNARSVWTIATMPYPAAHFATFPEELARRCILAGSSPRACEHCGAPWERVTETIRLPGSSPTRDDGHSRRYSGVSMRNDGEDGRTHPVSTTTGWQPTCSCENAGTGRSIVLDPFGGSGTVAQVATGNGRDSVYIDLNPKYLELAKQRIGPMFCEVAA